ncbi:MAG: penicillin-binding protein 2 [Candidatus Poribacteria bacterium]|nr:penicillin-binding protein 2 [Candidatus Poribacteria bacterium]
MIGRLILVQLLHNDELTSRSEKHRQIQTPRAARGKILDRHHNLLALNLDLISVWADPRFFNADAREISAQLAPVLETPKSEILASLQKKKREFIWLARDLPFDRLAKIQSIVQPIRGLKYQIHERRFYPKDDYACHIIGHTDFSNEGVDGIEYLHDSHLLGAANKSEIASSESSVELSIATDGKKRPISPRAVYETMSASGNDIILTIDDNIQYIAERELMTGCKNWKAKGGAAIVMHSTTGEILAMANYPKYNLNAYSTSQEAAKRNLTIWMQYEPGSVFKIVPAAAALEEKVATPESKEFCENGSYRLSRGHTIHDVKPNGWLKLSEILRKSSNIGILKIANRLTKKQFETYTLQFGFGEKTGIDLPHEQVGSLRGFHHWDAFSSASVPFGQGISATPVQVLNAMNVIAADGELLQPYITKEIRARDGKVIAQRKPKRLRRVLSSKTAAQMTEMLVGVTEGGSGRNARVEGYHVAGKTGTAQKAEKGKGYVDNKVVTTFVGFLPADDPQVSIVVVVDEPAGGALSSRVVAPIFKKIASETVAYLNQTDVFAPPPLAGRR